LLSVSFGLALAIAGGAGALGGLALVLAMLAFSDMLDPFFGILGAAGIMGLPITIGAGGAFGALFAGWFVWLRGNGRLDDQAEWLAVACLPLWLALLLSWVGSGDNVPVTLRSVGLLWAIALLATLPGWVLTRLALRRLRALKD
jgi:hypothetical protein